MTDPAVTMKTVQISANLLFAKLIDSIAVWVVLAGFALLGVFAYWYIKIRRNR